MNPFDIDIDKLKESKEVVEEKELLKLQLVSAFLKASANMDSQKIISLTGLHKSDLSRLRSMNVDRFSIDKIIDLLFKLGFSPKFEIEKSAVS